MTAPVPLVALDEARLDRATRWAGAVVLLLLLGNLLSIGLRDGLGIRWAMGLVPLLDVAEEQSLATFATVVVLVAAAGAAWLVSRLEPDLRRSWRLLAAALLLVAVDEVGTVHEDLSDALQQRLALDGVLYFAWVLPALALGAVFALVQVRFLLALPRSTASRLVLAGSLYVAAAAGLELVESGIYAVSRDVTLAYRLLAMGEELLELSALLLALAAVLRHLLRTCGGAVHVLGVADGRRPVREEGPAPQPAVAGAGPARAVMRIPA